MFGMNPLEILRLPLDDFHRICALAHEAERQNVKPLLRISRKGKEGGWLASIAAAVFAGSKAAK